MNTIRKILVPVDFSRETAEALRFAADLSRRYEAALDIVHVLHTPAYALPEGFVVPTAEQRSFMLAEVQRQLAQAEQDALDAGAVAVESRILEGFPSSEIIRVAKEERPDLIVMGTHGRTGMQHFLVGSIAENVVRLAPCAVVTLRAPQAA